MTADDNEPIIRPATYRQSETDGDVRRWYHLTRLQAGTLIGALVVLWFIWFIFTAKSVRLSMEPAVADADIDGGFSLAIGDVFILREGNYRLTAAAPGYYPLDVPLTVGEARNQQFRFAMVKLPGRIDFRSEPAGAEVTVDDTVVGATPLDAVEIPPGEHQVHFAKPRYQSVTEQLVVEGRHQVQTLTTALPPDWAEVAFTTTPAGAAIRVAGETLGTTPDTVALLAGPRTVTLKLAGYKAQKLELDIVAGQAFEHPPVTLDKADGLLRIATQPPGAGITVNDTYRGAAPLEVALDPTAEHRLQAYVAGYEPLRQTVRVASGDETAITLTLTPMMGEIVVTTRPADAELIVDGRSRGNAQQTLELTAAPHRIEIEKPGYAGYSTTITPRPGFTQELKVKLLTLAEARLASLTSVVTTAAGQELVLLDPQSFTMGASRREPGRRANEVLHEVEMTRLFYLARHEVTNAEFRAFASGHSSGAFEEQELDDPEQPVVNVSWQEAALYCNWLSERDGLPLFYRVEFGDIVGMNPSATGYRLPTEAEWAWAARWVDEDTEPLTFPWGDGLPPPPRHGNYADRAASHLVGRIVFGYNDNHIVSAPVGTFEPNARGLYDMGGNVAEWTNDFYEIPSGEPTKDPLGPSSGEYHVIRGSSWMHGTITDLRLSFRDYGAKGRVDLGFRIARFAE